MTERFEPVQAGDLVLGDIVRRYSSGRTRLVTETYRWRTTTGVEKVHITFEDSDYPFFLDTKVTNKWYRRVKP